MKTRRKNRLLALLLCLCTLMGTLPLSGTAYAAEQTKQVTVDGIQYVLDNTSPKSKNAFVADNQGYTGTSVTIPATITVEGKGSPWDGVWPVARISGDAFKDCANLTSVSLETAINLESIDSFSFYNCGKLTSVTFAPNGKLKSIGESAFERTRITSIQLPDTVETIGIASFRNTNLTSIEISANVTNIGSYAFGKCTSLTSVTFAPNSKLKSIESYTFSYSVITSIQLPNTVEMIGANAFDGTRLTSMEIPTSVTSITQSK